MRKISIAVMVALAFMAGNATALINPYAAYCGRMGYTYDMTETPDGILSYCVMPDGERCLPQEFIQGTCGKTFNYCYRNNLESMVSENPELCVYTDICLTCKTAEGAYVSSMLLAFEDEKYGAKENLQDLERTPDVTTTTYIPSVEGLCGDNICQSGEETTCLGDCPVIEQPKEGTNWLLIIAVALIAIALVYAYLTMKKGE